jgi:hypothetical protein
MIYLTPLYFMFNIWMTVLSTTRQEIFHVTLYDFINASILDVGHVEHCDVQYQGRALSVAQKLPIH